MLLAPPPGSPLAEDGSPAPPPPASSAAYHPRLRFGDAATAAAAAAPAVGPGCHGPDECPAEPEAGPVAGPRAAVQDDTRCASELGEDEVEYGAHEARDLRVLHVVADDEAVHDQSEDAPGGRYILLSSDGVLVNTFSTDLYQHHDMPASPQLRELERLRPDSGDGAEHHQVHHHDAHPQQGFDGDLVATGMRQLPPLFPPLAGGSGIAAGKLHDDYMGYSPLSLDQVHHNGHLDDVIGSLKTEKHCDVQTSVVVENTARFLNGHHEHHVEYLAPLVGHPASHGHSREGSPSAEAEDAHYDQLTTLQPGAGGAAGSTSATASPDDGMYAAGSAHGVAHSLDTLQSWAGLQQQHQQSAQVVLSR